MEIMRVLPSRPGSYEHFMHSTGVQHSIRDLRKGHMDSVLRTELIHPRLERFIGVIYRPHHELQSHYSTAIPPNQFDAYVWFDETISVRPLKTTQTERMEEMYPFGL